MKIKLLLRVYIEKLIVKINLKKLTIKEFILP